MKVSTLLSAAFLAALCLPAAGQNLKPGLWEMTNKMSSSNPEMEKAMAEMKRQLASMPPAQRKQMEEAMGKQGVQMGVGGAGAMSIRMCMTREMVEQSAMPVQQQGDCKVTRQQRLANTMKMAYTCSTPPSSGEGEYTFMGPDAYASKMTITSMAQGKPEKMTMEGTGKWLGADCGSVKPLPAAAMAPPAKK